MGIGDLLEQLWQTILDITSMFVLPDWAGLIGLIPWAILLLLVGPIVTLLALAWFVYVVRAPRGGVRFEEGPRRAEVVDGRPVLPRGEPYCYRDGLVYPANARRCDECGDELSVACPKCGVTRVAALSTCGNCGLVLKVEPRAVAMRPSGPPPGGAAAA